MEPSKDEKDLMDKLEKSTYYQSLGSYVGISGDPGSYLFRFKPRRGDAINLPADEVLRKLEL